MATKPKTAAAQRATYKGKYKGPDVFQGNTTTVAAWKKAGKPKDTKAWLKTYKAPVAPAPAPTAPAPTAPNPTAPNAYGNSTTSNANGTVQLQGNYDLLMDEADVEEQHNQELAEAKAMEDQALITETAQRNDFKTRTQNELGRLNSNLAARGLGSLGTVGGQKYAELATQHALQEDEISSQKKLADAAVASKRILSDTGYRNRLGNITLGKQAYTNQQSATNPTEGSQAEDAGVRATVPAPAKAPAAAAPAAQAKTAKTYRGKFAGPDIFQGNDQMNAAYKKQTAGKNLSDAAKRKIANSIAGKK